MAKEILLYSGIYSYSAAQFINELEANKGNDICVRGNCPGGDMFATYGMIAKFNEHPKAKKIKVDGIAASAFAYMTLCADDVECLDASTFLFHRAAYGSLEDEKSMDDASRRILDGINGKMRAALEAKINPQMWQAATGISYDDMFSMETRKDVILNAYQAKALGIVSKVNELTPEKKAEIVALASMYNIAAFSGDPIPKASTNDKTTIKTMTAAEFKAANPAAYAEIVAEGVKNEQTRVKTWLAWSPIDAEAAMNGVKEGKEMTPDVVAEFQVKAISASRVETAKSENAPEVKTPEAVAPQTDKDRAAAEFLANCKKDLGIA